MGEEPEVRIGTAERERALEDLAEHYSAGRLTLAEFEERTEVVMEARYQRDLDTVFVDLPRPHQPVPLLEPLPEPPPGLPAPAGAGTARWKTTVMALTPFVALVAFVSVKHWVVFLMVPVVAILLFAGENGEKG